MQRIRVDTDARIKESMYAMASGLWSWLALASQEPKCGMFGCMDGWSGRRSKPQSNTSKHFRGVHLQDQ
jgi:hypothetical protein